MSHYPSMVVAYLVALGGWLVIHRLQPRLWPAAPAPRFAQPWRELGFAMLGAVGVLAVGQLWTRGIRLPERGPLGPLLGAVNQLAIFAPILLVPLLRRHPWTTAWLPAPRLAARVGAGIGLAILAVTVYALVRDGAPAPWVVAGRLERYQHLDELTQVLLEDVTIAILFVRCSTAVGSRWAVVIVAALFAAGHVPAMLAGGAPLLELAGLLRDAGLGVAVILVLRRSQDVMWFWWIHFAMDMTQFARISGTG